MKIEELVPLLADGWLCYNRGDWYWFEEDHKPKVNRINWWWEWKEGDKEYYDDGYRIIDWFLREPLAPAKAWTKSLMHIKDGKVVK